MSNRDLLKRHDRYFADFARSLTPVEWAQPSLCSKWTAHDVLAHLVIGYSISVPSLCWSMTRHRMDFDGTNTSLAQRLAHRRSPRELIDSFETLVDHPRGIGHVFPPGLLLGDHVMHHLDIALALRMPAEVPAEVIDAVLATEVGLPNPFVPAKRNAAGLTLRATDTGWTSTADGDACGVVEGRAAHLASALAGRPHALAYLSGDGVSTLGSRITRTIGHPQPGV
ncbi:MAG: maleylpyruvate isomerase family mycothiol-dependent enzyme [Mycobacterium sp.]